MKKAYFQYYESFDAIIDKLRTEEARDKLRRAVIAYGLYGEEPEGLNEVEEIAFFCVRELIDQQKHRREINAGNRKQKPEPEQEPVEEPEPKAKAESFIKPTEEEVADYIKEKGYRVNAKAFMTHYEANGWKVGRNAMKNWRAAVANWEQREPKGGGTIYQQGEQTAEDYSSFF